MVSSSRKLGWFKKCRKQFKLACNEKMRINVVDDDDPSLVSKKFWSHVKSGSNSTRIPETMKYKGRFRTNMKDQADIFNTYFHDQFSSPSSYTIDIDFSNDKSSNLDFSPSRVYGLLRKVNTSKAAGSDGLHVNVLKHCASSLALPLSLLFTLSYKPGQIPSEWKKADIVPVHKKGDKSEVENYRPISLLCLVMKIFERCIRDELMLRCSHLLDKHQHGFLPRKSCTTQMVPFVDSLVVTLNNSARADVVYFDFSKAFDTVSYDIILHKLKYKYGIDGLLLKFLISYLKSRTQRVVVGGSCSSTMDVTSGVPQGSIIGPTLFIMFINDMITEVSPGTNIALYADDAKI